MILRICLKFENTLYVHEQYAPNQKSVTNKISFISQKYRNNFFQISLLVTEIQNVG